MAAIVVVLATMLIAGIYPFLTVDDAAGFGVLVVEGWVPDYALEATLELIRSDRYEAVYTTGGPIRTGRHLSQYGTWAEMSAFRLQRIGCNQTIHAAPAPEVWRDRTLISARTLATNLQKNGILTGMVDIVTMDCHSRRTRMLFQRALGEAYQVGIHAVSIPEIGPRNWFTCSEGVRSVLSELIGYGYARLIPGQGKHRTNIPAFEP